MKADFPDRLVPQPLKDSRPVADADQPYGRLRLETPALGQTDPETNLRRAAEMETGRGRNLYAIA